MKLKVALKLAISERQISYQVIQQTAPRDSESFGGNKLYTDGSLRRRILGVIRFEDYPDFGGDGSLIWALGSEIMKDKMKTVKQFSSRKDCLYKFNLMRARIIAFNGGAVESVSTKDPTT